MARWGFELDLTSWDDTLATLTGTGATERGMSKAASLLQADIQRRAPVDTGRLRDSYEVRIDRSDGGNVTGHVGSDVPYSLHQEYGTRHQSGTPHVRPALEANRSKLVELMFDDVFSV